MVRVPTRRRLVTKADDISEKAFRKIRRKLDQDGVRPALDLVDETLDNHNVRLNNHAADLTAIKANNWVTRARIAPKVVSNTELADNLDGSNFQENAIGSAKIAGLQWGKVTGAPDFAPKGDTLGGVSNLRQLQDWAENRYRKKG
jgi:hypothetical protein